MTVAALLSAALFGAFVVSVFGREVRASWRLPALAGTAFLVWSLIAIVREGPFGFWTEHTDSLWGVQVWMDLLLAIAVALSALVPAARAEGMRVGPWIALVCCTGSIGLCAMAARLLWLRGARTVPAPA